MPKMKVDEDTEMVIFSKEGLKKLDEYFKGTNAETKIVSLLYMRTKQKQPFQT